MSNTGGTDRSALEACTLCNRETDDENLCGDQVCRECHKSLSFDDCVSGAWVGEQRRAAGLPAVPR